MNKIARIIVLCGASALGGCMNTPAKVVETIDLSLKDALCVLEHDQDPVATIIVECDLPQSVSDEVTILSSASLKAKADAAARAAKK